MKKVAKILWLSFTVVVIIFYILSCLTPFILPEHFAFLSIISTFYLPIVVGYFIILSAWLFINKKVFAILLVFFFIGYKSLFSTFAFHPTAKWQWKKDSTTIRIMSWNVNRFGTPYLHRDSANGIRQQMLRYIQQAQPDILCFQDFRHNEVVGEQKPFFVNNLSDVFKAGEFSYIYYPFYYEYDGTNYCDKFGVAILSKLPITDTGSILNGGFVKNERSGYADVLFQSKKLKIYTAHFSSMSLWSSTDENEAGLKYLEDSTKQRARNIYSKLKFFGNIHAKEAKTIKTFINKSPSPVIFTGDLNSTPSSYVYNHLKGNLNDAFLNKDFGVGGTYNRIFPKPRIDVMFYSDEIEVTQFIRPAINLSDHFPLIADIRWKK